MKNLPIIFSGSMIPPILDNRKTMTRRTRGLERINERPDDYSRAIQLNDGTWSFWYPGNVDEQWVRKVAYPGGGGFKCPFGVPGDKLYVRETFFEHVNGHVHYRASHQPLGPWKPSIHMPKRLARIWLEVLSVKVERVIEISEEDAIAEGVRGPQCNCGECIDSTHIGSFQDSWNSLNAKRGYGWHTNPWVWVIEFKRIKP